MITPPSGRRRVAASCAGALAVALAGATVALLQSGAEAATLGDPGSPEHSRIAQITPNADFPPFWLLPAGSPTAVTATVRKADRTYYWLQCSGPAQVVVTEGSTSTPFAATSRARISLKDPTVSEFTLSMWTSGNRDVTCKLEIPPAPTPTPAPEPGREV